MFREKGVVTIADAYRHSSREEIYTTTDLYTL